MTFGSVNVFLWWNKKPSHRSVPITVLFFLFFEYWNQINFMMFCSLFKQNYWNQMIFMIFVISVFEKTPHLKGDFHVMHLLRSLCCGRHRCGRPAASLYSAHEFREGLGSWLPSPEHQGDPVLDRNSFTPGPSAPGRGSAHHAYRRPATSGLMRIDDLTLAEASDIRLKPSNATNNTRSNRTVHQNAAKRLFFLNLHFWCSHKKWTRLETFRNDIILHLIQCRHEFKSAWLYSGHIHTVAKYRCQRLILFCATQDEQIIWILIFFIYTT